MQMLQLKNTHFNEDYGILCSSFPKQNNRNGIYPAFCKIPCGGKTIAHSHFETELFFIVSGKGWMVINDETKSVQEGDLIHIPAFSQHELTNIGIEELVFMSVYSEDYATPALPESIVVTSAPPTPNGPLHLGHISGPYLAQDIMTRYLRLRLLDVHSHSGTDDHQNYVSEKAHFLSNGSGNISPEYACTHSARPASHAY